MAKRTSDAPAEAAGLMPEVFGATAGADELQQALRAVREHLGLEVAFVSEIVDGRRRFIRVDAAGAQAPIRVGDSNPVDEGYCQRVIDGRLPQLIRDARRIPEALKIPATAALPIGAHLSVPIRMKDGSVYGTFCCFSTVPDETLTDRDLGMMRVFADFAAAQIERQRQVERARLEATGRVQQLWQQDRIGVVYQPIHDFVHNRIVGFEALARFAAAPQRSPDIWFAEAAQVGLGEALEMAVIARALADMSRLPARSYLSLNVSPEHIVSGAVQRALRAAPFARVVLEVTEHSAIAEYGRIAAQLRSLRRRGLRLAIDDSGAGFASFRHILQLNPDVIKLDMSLIRGIDADRKRRALAAALIRFAEQTDSKVTAEGVETTAELATLRQLGVDCAQGYLLGRPVPISEVPARLQPTRIGAVRKQGGSGRLARRGH